MGILDNAKQVADAVHEFKNLELYQRVLGLHSDIIAMVEENLKLREENTDLKKKLEIKGRLRPKQQDGRMVYYLEEENGEKQGPYCAVCYDIDAKFVLAEVWNDGSVVCRFCNKFRKTSSR